MTESSDPVSQGMLELLGRLETEIDQGGWDQLPELFWIVKLNPDELPDTVAAGVVDEIIIGFGVIPAEIPRKFWEKADPAWRMLDAMAATIADMHRAGAGRIVPPHVYGVAWCCEAYGVGERTEDEARALGAAPRGTISAHPERVELRFVHAVDAAGTFYDVTRRRGGEAARHVWEQGRDASSRVEGSAVEALNELLRVCLQYDE